MDAGAAAPAEAIAPKLKSHVEAVYPEETLRAQSAAHAAAQANPGRSRPVAPGRASCSATKGLLFQARGRLFHQVARLFLEQAGPGAEQGGAPMSPSDRPHSQAQRRPRQRPRRSPPKGWPVCAFSAGARLRPWPAGCGRALILLPQPRSRPSRHSLTPGDEASHSRASWEASGVPKARPVAWHPPRRPVCECRAWSRKTR